MNKKKVMQFIDSNFPPCKNYTIITEGSDEAVAVLDYGGSDRLRIRVGYCDEGHNLYRLLQTDFI